MNRLLRFLTFALAMMLCVFALADERHAVWSAKLDKPGKAGEKAVVLLDVKLDDTWHLYSITTPEGGPFPTTVKLTAPLKFDGPVVQQKFERKKDENFGVDVEFWEKQTQFKVPVVLGDDVKKGAVRVKYQVCSGTTCMPPTELDVPIDGSPAKVAATDAAVEPTEKAIVEGGTTTAAPKAEQKSKTEPKNEVEQARKQGLLAYLLLAVSAGAVALLTPCVFPMIPITVSFFSKQKKDDDPKAGLKHAIAYCLGIIGTFTALGVGTAAIFGAAGISRLANNPILNLVLAVVFVALAFSLFGFFEIGIPPALLNKFANQKKAGYLGPVLMGLTFSLTSFTCTLPFVGALLVSASQGDLLWPILGMLAFSSVFALPFFLLALFPQFLAKLPKSGSWLATMKAFMGFVELAAAVKFVSSFDLGITEKGLGIITREVYLSLWLLLTVGAAAFMLGLIDLPKVGSGKIGWLRRGVGVLSLVGGWYLINGINGSSLGDLDAFLPPSPYPNRAGASNEKLSWLATYEEAKKEASTSGKPIFIDFTGKFCTNCRWMEKNMFPVPEIEQRLEKFVRVKLWTDGGTPSDNANQQMMKEMTNSVTLPAYVIVRPDGSQLISEYTASKEKYQLFLDKGLGTAPNTTAMR
jgi:thiol:disulfide interchange protein DsbD